MAEEEGKATYVRFYGLEESKKQLHSLCEQACGILEKNNIKSDILIAIVNSIDERVK